MDPKQQNVREKSSSLTAPGRLERSPSQSFKHSSHTNLSSTAVDEDGVGLNDSDLLIKVTKSLLGVDWLVDLAYFVEWSVCVAFAFVTWATQILVSADGSDVLYISLIRRMITDGLALHISIVGVGKWCHILSFFWLKDWSGLLSIKRDSVVAVRLLLRKLNWVSNCQCRRKL